MCSEGFYILKTSLILRADLIYYGLFLERTPRNKQVNTVLPILDDKILFSLITFGWLYKRDAQQM